MGAVTVLRYPHRISTFIVGTRYSPYHFGGIMTMNQGQQPGRQEIFPRKYIYHVKFEGDILNGFVRELNSVSIHLGRVTHICVSKQTIIVSYDGLSLGRRQAIIWTIVGMWLTETLGTHFSEILNEMHILSFIETVCEMAANLLRSQFVNHGNGHSNTFSDYSGWLHRVYLIGMFGRHVYADLATVNHVRLRSII